MSGADSPVVVLMCGWQRPKLTRMNEVGQRIRDLRQERGWTLKNLAARTGLSTSFLSQVERGLSSVSIGSLATICHSIGVELSEFFHSIDRKVETVLSDPQRTEVVRVADQPSINLSDATIRYQFLSREFPGRELEVLIAEITPGYHYPPSPHEGEEFGYVLEGNLRLTVEDEVHHLGPGDSYHLNASTSHGFEAEGDADVKLLWVQVPSFFQTRGGIRVDPAPRCGEKTRHGTDTVTSV